MCSSSMLIIQVWEEGDAFENLAHGVASPVTNVSNYRGLRKGSLIPKRLLIPIPAIQLVQ